MKKETYCVVTIKDSFDGVVTSQIIPYDNANDIMITDELVNATNLMLQIIKDNNHEYSYLIAARILLLENGESFTSSNARIVCEWKRNGLYKRLVKGGSKELFWERYMKGIKTPFIV